MSLGYQVSDLISYPISYWRKKSAFFVQSPSFSFVLSPSPPPWIDLMKRATPLLCFPAPMPSRQMFLPLTRSLHPKPWPIHGFITLEGCATQGDCSLWAAFQGRVAQKKKSWNNHAECYLEKAGLPVAPPFPPHPSSLSYSSSLSSVRLLYPPLVWPTPKAFIINCPSETWKSSKPIWVLPLLPPPIVWHSSPFTLVSFCIMSCSHGRRLLSIRAERAAVSAATGGAQALEPARGPPHRGLVYRTSSPQANNAFFPLVLHRYTWTVPCTGEV